MMGFFIITLFWEPYKLIVFSCWCVSLRRIRTGELGSKARNAVAFHGGRREEVFSAESSIELHSCELGQPLLQPCTQDSDCLPATALVWVQGHALPQPVSELMPGDEVLCFDHVACTMRHVRVLQAERSEGPAIWATITLADGTSVMVTADHPLLPFENFSPSFSRASDLQPGNHLVVLKAEPVRVQNVRTHDEIVERMAVSVYQPHRHTLFVSTSGDRVQMRAVAVGSADMSAQAMVIANRTFLDMVCGSESFARAEVRSCSSPPVLSAAAAESRASNAQAEGDVTSLSIDSEDTEDDDISVDIILRPPIGEKVEEQSCNSSDPEVGLSQSCSGASGSTVGLGEILQLKADGLQSRGSSGHADGICRPCAHEAKFQYGKRGRPCINGMLCNFCHADHGSQRPGRKTKK
eukprot:CAMPEP_0180589026 /NCGR_PEP_ID=MMETSP1037_2-20121125/17941_1 /TAXON_ID=632150 /ORGANISM="Azadinium spinosum, Strain 3D9" /LENGTH=408 /DNA_ID=CAMNT_0022607199 /DNA_START=330 /DNA_END=1556 /DNA_ORIENTATION=+